MSRNADREPDLLCPHRRLRHNNGLANTAGGAFLTIQKAFDVIWGTLDLSTYQVTVQVADGTYTGRVVANGPAVGVKNDQSVVASSGSPPVIIQGNSGTPANVLVNTTGDAFLRVRQRCFSGP